MVNNMENAEEVMQILDRFTRLKQKEIPKELDDYLQYVAKTGDTVFKWASLKYLFREKLLNVIKHFHETTPRVDEIPQYPNVDPFNYENMKSSLLERLELFNAAPFTIQRLCELLIDPRKQYSRIDKFMRALEKNILVSTIEPGRKRSESENGDSLDSVVNGDLSLDVNVDIDMENDTIFNMEQQNGNGHGPDTAAGAPDSEGEREAEREAAPEVGVDAANAAETKDKPVVATVVETTKDPHRPGDDDILPNPKKPKLDLPEEAEEQPASAEVKLGNATKSAAATEVEVEVKEVDEKERAVVAAEGKQPADSAEEVSSAKEHAEDHTEKDVTEEKAEAVHKIEADAKQSEKVAPVDEKAAPAVEEAVESKSSVAKDEQVLTGEEKELEKEQDKEKEKADAVVENKNEKIVEKQEIEKGEKEETPAPKVDSTSEAEAAAPAEAAADSNKASDVDTKEVKESVAPKIAVVVEKEAVVATSSVADSPATVDIPANTQADAKPAAEVASDGVVDSTTAKGESVPAKAAELDSAKCEEISSSVSTEKTESDGKTPPAKDGAKDAEAVAAGTAAAAVPVAEPSAVGAVETTVPVIVETAEALASSSGADTAEVTAVTILDENTATPVVVPIQPDAPAPVAIPVVVAIDAGPPTLALNDQPMEDTSLDEILPTSAAIDEVVMAETVSVSVAVSTAAGVGVGGATEMATDATEAATTKDEEPAGMEVDDTSQPPEAMDQ